MKRLYLLMAFAGIAFFARAQEALPSEKKQQDIEALFIICEPFNAK